jgi:hypothetical protein
MPKNHKSTTKATTRHAPKPLEWTAIEYQPRRRWWWYAIVGYLSLTIAALSLVAGDWLLAILALLIGVALFRWNLVKPRRWRYGLDGSALTITGRGVQFTRDLTAYRSLYIDTYGVGIGWPSTRAVLLPKARFQSEFDVYMPEVHSDADVDREWEAFRGLTRVVPEDKQLTAEPPRKALRTLVRWLRLG